MYKLQVCKANGCKVSKHFQSSTSKKKEKRGKISMQDYGTHGMDVHTIWIYSLCHSLWWLWCKMLEVYWKFFNNRCFFSLLEQIKEISSNHKDCQNLQQKKFKSAMLLPSCAFVLRNVHLCQCFPRQCHKSAHRYLTDPQFCQWLMDQGAVSCSWHQNNLSDTTVFSCCSALCSISLLSSLQQICLLQDVSELHCLNVYLGHKKLAMAQRQNIKHIK